MTTRRQQYPVIKALPKDKKGMKRSRDLLSPVSLPLSRIKRDGKIPFPQPYPT